MFDATMPRLGATVTTPRGTGVVTDRDNYDNHPEVLVRLPESDDDLAATHGQWFDVANVTVTGFDPSALVWSGPRMVPAATLVRNSDPS